MKLKKLAAGLGALGLLAIAAPSLAAPTLTYTTANYGVQVLDPFGSIDWNSGSTAVAVGYNPFAQVNVGITTTYFSNAVGILDPDGNTFTTPGITPPPGSGNGWEFTVVATIIESSVCLVSQNGVGVPAGPGNPCVIATFSATGGSWNVYFDALADSSTVTGAGMTDGDLVMTGAIDPGLAGTFTASGTGGSGIFDFRGAVTYTNSAYITPDIEFSRATSTLQIGTSTGGWTPATGLPGAGGAAIPGIPQGAILLQADANQSYGIPEPTTLALLGLGLIGFVVGSRRRVC